MNLRALYVSFVCSFMRYCFMPPTLRSMLMLLSLRMMNRSLGVSEALLSPSKARPPLMEPSPMMATTRRCSSCLRWAATDMPSAADMELLAWPQANVS